MAACYRDTSALRTAARIMKRGFPNPGLAFPSCTAVFLVVVSGGVLGSRGGMGLAQGHMRLVYGRGGRLPIELHLARPFTVLGIPKIRRPRRGGVADWYVEADHMDERFAAGSPS